jgi:hypothetical protein
VVRWDERLGDLFDDLEQQAEALVLAERDAEVAEQSRAEYAQVELADRLHASTGRRLLLAVAGVGPLEGALTRTGAGWLLLDDGRHEWIVATPAVASLRGLSGRALGPEVRPVTSRLGLSSALRGVADARADAVLHQRDGSLTRGHLARVGADFVEVGVGQDGGGHTLTVPVGTLAAVRSL